MTALNRNLRWLPNGDGSIDGHWPNGDKAPTVTTLDWDETLLNALRSFVALQNTGTPLLVGLAQYATGTGVATASYSVVSITGTPLAGIYSTSGANLTSPGTLPGSGFFKLGLIDLLGNVKFSNPIAWTYQTVVVGDTVKPTVPTALQKVEAIGAVDISWAVSTDPGPNASGMAAYEVYANNAYLQDVSATTQATPTFASFNVGAGSAPAASFNVTGATAQITAQGLYQSTVDDGVLIGVQVVGDFDISCQLTSLTTPSTNARFGLQVRESLATGSKTVHNYYRHSGSPSVRVGARDLDGGAVVNDLVVTQLPVNGVLTNISIPNIYLRIKRVGNVITSTVSANGTEIVESAHTLAMTPQVYVGFLVASQTAAVLNTANFAQLALVTTTGRVNFHRVIAPGSVTYEVLARDVAGNKSDRSLALIASAIASASQIRWHPGHLINTYTKNSLAASQVSEIQTLKAASGGDVVGIELFWDWRSIETAKNVYNFTPLINALNALDTAGLIAALYLEARTFGGTARNMPDYIAGEDPGGGICEKNGRGTITRTDRAGPRARWLKFWTELGAAIGQHPALDIIRQSELDPGIFSNEFGPLGFSQAGYMDGERAWVETAKAAFPKCSITAPANFCPTGPQDMEAWVKYCYDRGVGLGGPDVFPQPNAHNRGPTHTDFVIRGLKYTGIDPSGPNKGFSAGGIDYRGLIYYYNECQDPDYGKGYVFTPQTMYDYARSTTTGIGQSHMVWWRKQYTWANRPANTQMYWDDVGQTPPFSQTNPNMIVKSWLEMGNHPMPSTPPAFYGGNVDTS